MSKRNYNVFFNTHTVSGIVISVALYIIFFAGSFALFRDEIKIWESSNNSNYIEKQDVDYDKILDNLDEKYNLKSRNIVFRGVIHDKVAISLSAQKDTLENSIDPKRKFLYIDINTLKEQTYTEQYNLGEFLYRLHFFSQIPYVGIYLAGLVSFFFLFAIVTGVIVHWKKIISNFYHFNPKATLKRLWTDAHTALGIIGLPYQFIFAISGAYFGLSILILLPANILHGGDRDKLFENLQPGRKIEKWKASSNQEFLKLTPLVKETEQLWGDLRIKRCTVSNFGGTNMKYVTSGELNDKERFIGTGRVIYDAYSGKKEFIKNPNELNYLEDSQRVLGRLHFATYGGIGVKIAYFILAFITCFVIITGVLIWIEARNKKTMHVQHRLYTAKVGHIYLAVTLSMLPVTALAFSFVKLTQGYFINNQSSIYTFYFVLWMLFILYYRFKRDNYYINKTSLLLGGIFGLLVPLVNGIVSGNWIWKTFAQNQHDILLVDVLWVIISIISFFVYSKIKPSIKDSSTFTKNPIDYTNVSALKAKEKEILNQKESSITIDKNELDMRTKIIILWIFLGLGWIIHHMYGLFNIYYNETLIMEGATGEAPLVHHIYRIVFEGMCLLFALLTIEFSKKWFKWVSFIWAIIAGLYNVYHFVEAIIHESGNISEIFMLALVSIASTFLVINIYKWKKED